MQRVTRATVSVGGHEVSHIAAGLMCLVGIAHDDTTDDVKWLAAKLVQMRIFDDENGVMNKSVLQVDGEIMLVSQFTLHASTRKGNRPSYIAAARPEHARPLYDEICDEVQHLSGKPVARGSFGDHMAIDMVNDGPVTIIIDSRQRE